MATAALSQAAASRMAVVLNGHAGGVDARVIRRVRRLVGERDVFVSREAGEARRVARAIVEAGYETVLTGGGDGTFVRMVTLLTEEARRAGRARPRLGVLRLGTGNAVARALGVPCGVSQTLAAARRALRDGRFRPFRLLEVEGALTPVAGLGIDAVSLADYAQTRAWLARSPLTRPLSRGAPAYALSILGRSMPRYLRYRPHQVEVVNRGALAFRVDGVGENHAAIPAGQPVFHGPCRIVAMSTIAGWGFGARIFPHADDRADRFHLRIANIDSRTVARHGVSLWRGTYRSPAMHDFLCERISLSVDRPMPLQIGGDPVGDRRQLLVRLAAPVEMLDVAGA